MKLSREIFTALVKMPKEGQEKALEERNFDFMSDCDEYNGKIIDKLSWLKPDIEILQRFFERTLDDPDDRMAAYEKDANLSDVERNEFKDYLITEALEDEYHPGLFTGILTCGDDSLVVVSERTGGAWDCEASFCGIYKDLNQAIREIGGPTGQSID